MKKIEILNTLREDTQENIRFIESKTTIIIAIIGAILVYLLDNLSELTCNFTKYNCIFNIVFFLLIINIIICSFFLFKTIYPISNPKSYLPKEYENYPNLYLSDLNTTNGNPSLDSYNKAISNEDNLELAIELEYLKTSVIRNEKLENFKKLIISIFSLVVIIIKI